MPNKPLKTGNINLFNRPLVKNDDGSISTLRSMSFQNRDGNILIPTISDSGKVYSPNEAIENYRKTGRHLGVFKTQDDADNYAKRLHEEQQRLYDFAMPNSENRTRIEQDPYEELLQLLSKKR